MSIRSLLAERVPSAPVSDTLADRASYSRDSWQRGLVELAEGRLPFGGRMPAAVVWPRSTEDVVEIVELARAEGLVLAPFGAGSGVCGGIQPDDRTLVVDLKRMADHRIDAETPLLDVGPGATGINLEQEVQRRGFTIGHFPSSIICSTVGGWVAARGAGQCSSRYGKIEDMVASAECVLGNGRVVRFHRRAGGLDLLPLVIGSEGALGVITRLSLRLCAFETERQFLAFELPDFASGTAALRRLMQDGLRPAVARLYDPLDTQLFERSAKKHRDHGEHVSARAPVPTRKKRVVQAALERPRLLNAAVDLFERSPFGRWLLMLVFEGEGAAEDAARANVLVTREGGASLGEGPARHWFEHRYDVSFAQSKFFLSGAFDDTMEVAASWSQLDALYHGVREALGRHVALLVHLSHPYPDGCNIYFSFAGSAKKIESYDSAWRDALEAARAAGGAISHHHGVGRSKARALARDLGPALPVLRRVLGAWDPQRLMNPGVLVPADAEPEDGASYPELGLDERSELVTLDATMTLASAEQRVRAQGFTLGAALPGELSLAEWLARGFPGARDAWLDPADHLLAGLDATFHDGARLALAPVPRRATGPDLSALLVGAGHRLGTATRCTLRVRRVGAREPRPLPFAGDRSPPVTRAEQEAFEDLLEALSVS